MTSRGINVCTTTIHVAYSSSDVSNEATNLLQVSARTFSFIWHEWIRLVAHIIGPNTSYGMPTMDICGHVAMKMYQMYNSNTAVHRYESFKCVASQNSDVCHIPTRQNMHTCTHTPQRIIKIIIYYYMS